MKSSFACRYSEKLASGRSPVPLSDVPLPPWSRRAAGQAEADHFSGSFRGSFSAVPTPIFRTRALFSSFLKALHDYPYIVPEFFHAPRQGSFLSLTSRKEGEVGLWSPGSARRGEIGPSRRARRRRRLRGQPIRRVPPFIPPRMTCDEFSDDFGWSSRLRKALAKLKHGAGTVQKLQKIQRGFGTSFYVLYTFVTRVLKR